MLRLRKRAKPDAMGVRPKLAPFLDSLAVLALAVAQRDIAPKRLRIRHRQVKPEFKLKAVT